MIYEIMFYVLCVTVVLVFVFGGLTLSSAWDLGGEFYIDDFKGRRKMWIERLLDGYEILRKM